MITNEQLVDRIERASDATPICEHCGQPTTIVERDDTMWLECTTLAEPRDRLRSLLRFDFGRLHTQRSVLELEPAA